LTSGLWIEPWRFVRVGLLFLAQCFTAYLIYGYVRVMLFGASNILGRPPRFPDAAVFVGFAGLQIGAIAGVVVATAWHTRRLVPTLTTGTILTALLVLADAYITFSVP
jgi:hypothetical protein